MPWNRLRLEKPSDRDLRRRTLVESAECNPPQFSPVENNTEAQGRLSEASPTRPSRLRDSVVSLSAVNDVSTFERAVSPPLIGRVPKHHRFSLLKFRHASDSQLSKTAKEQAESEAPPVPSFATPAIITTAPTMDNIDLQKRKQAFTLPRKFKEPNPGTGLSNKSSMRSLRTSDNGTGKPASHNSRPNPPSSRVTFDQPEKLRSAFAPPAYGDESSSSLALPVSRLSESSRSDGSMGDHGLFATTTTTHTVSTTTTFFRLPRRKKDKGPLFPLPPKVETSEPSSSGTPRFSTSARASDSPVRTSFPSSIETGDGQYFRHGRNGQSGSSQAALALTSTAFAAPGSSLLRSDTTASRRSAGSSVTAGRPPRLDVRGRSSTMSSLHKIGDDDGLPTPSLPQSTRTSTSTTGRASLGGLFNLSRLRQSSEPMFSRSGMSAGTPGTPGSTRSNQNSIQLARETPVVIPERQEGDTPAKYLARLEEVVSRGALATLLSKSEDEFSKNVLRSFMRRFKFFEDPLDMAVRKMLMHVELPKETQHIDRTLQSFADRYHECNPGIFASPDEAYFVAFSILILHTDTFNKNNKHKMQKSDYTKNTRGQGVAQEILECFYDNIAYTPFIHVEDDVDVTGERIIAQKSRKAGFKGPGPSSLRKSGTGPIDPYTLILDSKLDSIRPSLDDVLVMEDPFKYLGPGASLNLSDLNRAFFKTGVIQILSSRSRPEAFMTPVTATNPAETSIGVVDMKVTKVGILWRKDPKKKKARSPWQEWGAILTGSQLYFFKNLTWIKLLMHQYEHHTKHGRSNSPVVFKPPLEQFKPDFLLTTEDVVALVDAQYKRHKHAFVFIRQNAFQEIFLADTDADMNDWLAKLNYAATFRTAGVRMRGLIGGHTEGNKSRDSATTESEHSVSGPKGDVLIRTGRLGDELTQQIMIARRQIMAQKIAEANEKLAVAEKQLDGQLRNARHLRILAPIQDKTKDEVVYASYRLATNIRWTRMESWRVRCHRDILAMDLEEDMKLGAGKEEPVHEREEPITSPSKTQNQPPNRLPFSRLNSRTSTATSQNSARTSRPSSQPSGIKLFSMDDIFRSPSRLRQHGPQSSWELPPLSFDRKNSVATSKRMSLGGLGSQPEPSIPDAPSVYLKESSEPSAVATELATPAARLDEDEHQLLVEAGLVSPESVRSEHLAVHDHGSDEDRERVSDLDGNTDSLSKVRHSLQRKIQNAHVPIHHRNKRGKDSSSSTAMTEDNASVHESEGLIRGTGTFTVHGKKASVVKFGSEWQNVSPEERLKLRKQAHADDPKLSVPQSVEDDSVSLNSETSREGGWISVTSGSTVTATSLGHVTTSEPQTVAVPPSPLTDTQSYVSAASSIQES